MALREYKTNEWDGLGRGKGMDQETSAIVAAKRTAAAKAASAPKPTPVATIIVNPPKAGGSQSSRGIFPAVVPQPIAVPETHLVDASKLTAATPTTNPVIKFVNDIQSFFQNLFKPALGQTYKTNQWDGLGKSRRKNLPPKTLGDLGYETNQWDGVGTMSELERKG